MVVGFTYFVVITHMLEAAWDEVGFLIFGFYCTSKNLLVKESLLVKVRQQVKKDLVKNVVMYNEAGLIKL